MNIRYQEVMEVGGEPLLDDSTIELFRQYLKEAILRPARPARPAVSLLSWSDN